MQVGTSDNLLSKKLFASAYVAFQETESSNGFI